MLVAVCFFEIKKNKINQHPFLLVLDFGDYVTEKIYFSYTYVCISQSKVRNYSYYRNRVCYLLILDVVLADIGEIDN